MRFAALAMILTYGVTQVAAAPLDELRILAAAGKSRSDCIKKCSDAQAKCEKKLTHGSSASAWQKCSDDNDACVKKCNSGE